MATNTKLIKIPAGSIYLILFLILTLLPLSLSGETEKYYISVGSFVYAENAEELIKKLEKRGMKTFTETVVVNGTRFTRVTLDIEYSSRYEAERAARVLSEADLIKRSGAKRLWLRIGDPPAYVIKDAKQEPVWHEYKTQQEVSPEPGIWTAESVIEGHRTLSSIIIEEHKSGYYRFIYPEKEVQGLAGVFGSDNFLVYADSKSHSVIDSFPDKSIDNIKKMEGSAVFSGRILNSGHIVIDEIWQDGKRLELPEGSRIEFKKR